MPHGNATFSSQRVAISSLSYVITEQSDINYDTYKVNGQPVGGIRLISTITGTDAQSSIIKNDKYGEDVYCLIKKDALSLVMSLAGKGFAGFVGPEVHDNNRIYNLYHYHMTFDKELKEHANTHVFFTY